MSDEAAANGAVARRAAQPSLAEAVDDALSSELTVAAHAERLLRLAHALTGATSGAMMMDEARAPVVVGPSDPALLELARTAREDEAGELRQRDRLAKRIGAGDDAFVLALRIAGGQAALAIGWERLTMLAALSERRGAAREARFDADLFRDATALARGDWRAAQRFADRLRIAAEAEAVVIGDFEDRLLTRHVVSDAPSLARTGAADDAIRARLSALARGEADDDGVRLGAPPDGYGLLLIGAPSAQDRLSALSGLFDLPSSRRRRISGFRRFRAPLIAVLTLAALAAAPLPDGIEAPASVTATVNRTVTAPLSARLLEMRVAEGDEVAEGDVVAQFDVRDLDSAISQDRAALAAALTRLQDARARRDEAGRRDAELEMEQIQARKEQNETLRRAATLSATVGGIVLRSPGEERIGAAMSIGEPVVEIAGGDGAFLEAWISERDRARLAAGTPALFRLDADPDRDIEAEISHISPSAEQRDAFTVFRVELEVAAPPDWSVGMQGVVAFDHRRTPAALIAYERLRQWLARRFYI